MATRDILLGLLAALLLGGCGQGAANADAHPWPTGLPVAGKAHDGTQGCLVVVVRNAALPLCADGKAGTGSGGGIAVPSTNKNPRFIGANK